MCVRERSRTRPGLTPLEALLEIDQNLPEAHTALALVVQNYDWDWQTAEKEFRRAIDLDPNYATAHHWYAEHLMWRGRFEEAFRESERARQLDPLSLTLKVEPAFDPLRSDQRFQDLLRRVGLAGP